MKEFVSYGIYFFLFILLNQCSLQSHGLLHINNNPPVIVQIQPLLWSHICVQSTVPQLP